MIESVCLPGSILSGALQEGGSRHLVSGEVRGGEERLTRVGVQRGQLLGGCACGRV